MTLEEMVAKHDALVAAGVIEPFLFTIELEALTLEEALVIEDTLTIAEEE